MPKSLTHLQVFVSGPSDVEREKVSVRTEASLLNKNELHSRGIQLDVITSDDIVPDFANYAQEVVMRQGMEDFDIFIGILWGRFGTSTPQAGSGTEEEFDAAYKRWRQDNHSCRLMIYFSKISMSPDSIEPDQIKKVRIFHDRISELGGFRVTYQNHDQFSEFIRRHLLRVVQDYGHTWGPVESPPPEPQDLNTVTDEPTVLDLAADAEEALQNYLVSITDLSTIISDVGTELTARTREIEELARKGSHPSPRKVRTVLRTASDNMTTMADLVTTETSNLKSVWDKFRVAILTLVNLVELNTDEDIESAQGLSTSMTFLSAAMTSTLTSLSSMRESIERLPPAERSIRRASRVASQSIYNLETELTGMVKEIEEITIALLDKVNNQG